MEKEKCQKAITDKRNYFHLCVATYMCSQQKDNREEQLLKMKASNSQLRNRSVRQLETLQSLQMFLQGT